jgi:hypothetical protein
MASLSCRRGYLPSSLETPRAGIRDNETAQANGCLQREHRHRSLLPPHLKNEGQREEMEMSDLSFMSDVSMAELRVLSVVGLLATAIITTLLTMLFASGGAALGRLVRYALARYHGVADGATGAGPLGPRRDLLVSNGRREVRARQRAWRLRH